jgi:hypothetical protein
MSFDTEYKKLCEGYGRIKETKYKLFPRNLKGKISEQFIKSLQQEFYRLTRPQTILDEETGESKTVYPEKKKILSEIQKALPFLIKK